MKYVASTSHVSSKNMFINIKFSPDDIFFTKTYSQTSCIHILLNFIFVFLCHFPLSCCVMLYSSNLGMTPK